MKWFILMVGIITLVAAIGAPNQPNTPPGSDGGILVMYMLAGGCVVWWLGVTVWERVKLAMNNDNI